MGLRSLLNLVYFWIVEGRDEGDRRKLDAALNDSPIGTRERFAQAIARTENLGGEVVVV